MRSAFIFVLDIWFVPNLCLCASSTNTLVAYLQNEVTLFQSPATISTYECQALCRKTEGNSLCLAWLKFDLGEITQTLVIWYDRCYEVTTVKQYSLLTILSASVLNVYTNSQHVSSSKLALVYTQVAVLIGSIAYAIAKWPLQRNLCIVCPLENGCIPRSSRPMIESRWKQSRPPPIVSILVT